MKKRFLLGVLFMGLLSAVIAQNLNPILSKMGDDEWQSAYDDLKGIMKKKKKNIEAKFYAGICLTKLYRPEEAIALFKLSAELGPDIPMYYVFFAEAYIRAGRTQDAKNIFARASKDNIEEFDMPQFLSFVH
jgi:tetratricopeptide (TPR) repeat protein